MWKAKKNKLILIVPNKGSASYVIKNKSKNIKDSVKLAGKEFLKELVNKNVAVEVIDNSRGSFYNGVVLQHNGNFFVKLEV